MSETSRKRSRKSKLVPRQFAVSEDELDIELQIPPSKQPKVKRKYMKKATKTPGPTTPQPGLEEAYNTSVLKKINASAKEDTVPKSKSPRKFEINIEVEAYDDEEIVENSDDKDNVIPLNEEMLKKPVEICSMPIVLSRDIILNAADDILKTSTNIADKILNINVRNTIGYIQPQILDSGCLEHQIQNTLEEWRMWQFRSFHREDPLFYKCYICTKSYWYLSEFRDHMSEEHADDETITIGLEKYEMHEANVIAYHKKLIVIKDIYTPGLCYRCGKDYNAHELDFRQHNRYYRSEGCSKQFFSCMGVRDHFPWCVECKRQNKPIKCEICKSRFDTEDDLNSHLVLSHSVRSDIPIMVRYKCCMLCGQRYSCGYLHKCEDDSTYSECPHCSMSFPSKKSLDIHTERSNVPYKCEVCGVIIKHSCLKYNHMLEHTDKYMIVKKCVECEGLNVFLSNDNALAHRALEHKREDIQQTRSFPNILIPSSCQYMGLPKPEPVPKEQNLVLISEDSVPGSETESVPACQQQLKEEDEVSESELEMENVKVKEEPVDPEYLEDLEDPEDSQDSLRLVIKEEIEEYENEILDGENQTEDHQINVKEEEEEEPEEYEEDIFKLNFDIEDLLVKKESTEEEEEEYITVNSEESQELDDDENSQESLQQSKEMEESNLEPHVDRTKKKQLYRCAVCGFIANHQLYKEHLNYDCGNRKTYLCSQCEQKFMSLKKYLGHFVDHGYKRLTCPECRKDFSTYSLLAQHVHSHVKQNFTRVKLITHNGMSKPDHQCRKCIEKVATKDFFKHWEIHLIDRPAETIGVVRPAEDKMHEIKIKETIARLLKQPKDCNQCNHRFKRINECKRHLIEHLLTDAYKHKLLFKELRCQMCESGFPTPERYKHHMRDHASLPVYKCELCDRTFSDSSNFTKHKKVHNLKVVVCDLCGKKFQCKGSLEKHMESHNDQHAIPLKYCNDGKPHKYGCLRTPKHKTTQPITCNICNKKFYFDTCYRRHVRYFHEKVNLGFRCIICNERFESLKSKWNHMWEVHKERKHKADCPICQKSFRKYADVRAHARSDHGTEISVLSLKEPTNSTININKYLKKPAVVKRVGIVETLVVYESD